MKKSGITIIRVKQQKQGLKAAKDILYKEVDNQTLLFFSGGSTPKDLYRTLAQERRLKVKAVSMVDERLDLSNQRMIREAGLLAYFKENKIPFYPILRSQDYNKKIKYLLDHFPKSVAIMGIGEDGHTAGLPPGIQNSKFKIQNYVTEINNFPGKFKDRITLTFKALSEIGLLIILVLGSAKKNALKKMFEEGSLEEIPARFYKLPKIAKKTILITDQKI